MAPASLSPTLEKNLRALGAQNRPLVDRLLQPSAVDHVILSPDGPSLYRHHGDLLPLDLRPAVLKKCLAGWPEDAQRACLFGLGLGELVAHLLRRRPGGRLVAWERDPYLVRETLSRWDYSASLESGRLELRLGVDLAADLSELSALPRVDHPTLRQVYAAEHSLIVAPPQAGRWIALGLGSVFVDELAGALHAEGHRVFPVELSRWPHKEIERALEALDPQCVMTVNTNPALSELCDRLGRPLIVWEVDPSLDRRPERVNANRSTRVFTNRKAALAGLQDAGYASVAYLPLAASQVDRHPVPLDELEERYRSQVCFVGASLAEGARASRRKFLHLYASWRCAPEENLEGFETHLDQVLAIQHADDVYRIPELAEEHYADFLDAARRSHTRQDPVQWLAEIAAAGKRWETITALGRQGITVWGDEGWADVHEHGGVYRGRAHPGAEINRIYSGGLINLDVNRMYQIDVVPLRVFEVLACGGFLLTEHCDPVADMFEVGRDLETYRSRVELVEKVEYFLAHPDEAGAIDAHGRETFLREHTLRNRVERMLADR